jgi:exopolyphosphatase/guanosine-5'-triphosphate,3'-diphosphate pyrophosphatase
VRSARSISGDPSSTSAASHTELRGSDLQQVAAQLGRDPFTEFNVVARCPGGHPLVVRNHPIDHEGKPFPTLYWLTCPDAVRAVARVESAGWIKRLSERAEAEQAFGAALDAAHEEYAKERARVVGEAARWGGVGGSRGGVKCLHAHYANHLAGGADPVGAWVAERVEPVHPPYGQRVAAVDMGTNSIRLLVAEPSNGGVVEVARDMVITRLGEGVDQAGRLKPEALDRTMAVLSRYVRRARALGAERIRVGATSAVRDAGSRDALFTEVAAITGAAPEVLSGEREAGLSFLGATEGLDQPAPFLVFDIGGGSTELVLGTDQPDVAVSVDVGSVRTTERVRPADPPTANDLEAMRRLAAEGLALAERTVPSGGAATLVGVAGTTTTVQAIALGLRRYDPEAIHRSFLSRSDAERVSAELSRMTVAERAALPVMAPGRADVIMAGSIILLEILRRWRFDRLLVSEQDIMDGLAIEMVTGRWSG